MVRNLYMTWAIYLVYSVDQCCLHSLASRYLLLPQNKLRGFLPQDLCPSSSLCSELSTPSICINAPFIIQDSVQWGFLRGTFVTLTPLFSPILSNKLLSREYFDLYLYHLYADCPLDLLEVLKEEGTIPGFFSKT